MRYCPPTIERFRYGTTPLGFGLATFRAATRTEEEILVMGNRLYVGNLSFHSDTEAVRAAFTQYGEVTDVHIVTDRATGQSRGFAFVTMGSDEQAQRAIEGVNGQVVDGRPLRVNEAEERPQR